MSRRIVTLLIIVVAGLLAGVVSAALVPREQVVDVDDLADTVEVVPVGAEQP